MVRRGFGDVEEGGNPPCRGLFGPWLEAICQYRLNTVLTYMVNNGLYMPSLVWVTKKDFDLTKVQVLWQLLLTPK